MQVASSWVISWGDTKGLSATQRVRGFLWETHTVFHWQTQLHLFTLSTSKQLIPDSVVLACLCHLQMPTYSVGAKGYLEPILDRSGVQWTFTPGLRKVFLFTHDCRCHKPGCCFVVVRLTVVCPHLRLQFLPGLVGATIHFLPFSFSHLDSAPVLVPLALPGLRPWVMLFGQIACLIARPALAFEGRGKFDPNLETR